MSHIPVYSRTSPNDLRRKGGRRIWNHAFERQIFSPQEIATMGAPVRRAIYIASLEAHIERLHTQLLSLGHNPVHPDDLMQYRGVNCKSAKSMIAAFQFDIVAFRLNLLQLERAVSALQNFNTVHHTGYE